MNNYLAQTRDSFFWKTGNTEINFGNTVVEVWNDHPCFQKLNLKRIINR